MKRFLKMYVRDIFEKKNLPDIKNRRFYPRTEIIRSHMVRARKKLQLSLIDQECLLEKKLVWEKEDPSVKIYFRPKSVDNTVPDIALPNVKAKEIEKDSDEEEDEDLKFEEGDSTQSLLFVYQAKWQTDLLRRYGEEIVLLDATYKTTRYVLPLFFLVVKTNVDYQIVCAFVTENETKRAIMEGLQIIKSWNPGFNPRNCMTDYCNEEIDALEQVFQGEESNKTEHVEEFTKLVTKVNM